MLFLILSVSSYVNWDFQKKKMDEQNEKVEFFDMAPLILVSPLNRMSKKSRFFKFISWKEHA